MWFLDFRTRDVGGPVATAPMLYEDDRLRGVGLSALPPAHGGLTFVLHGFNNDREEGRAKVAGFTSAAIQLVPALGSTRVVGVLWPGDAIFGFLSYPTEEADADRTAAGFARELAAARLPVAPSFVAHSLGCRVALQTVDTLVRGAPDRAWVDQMVLFAGAVDDDALARSDRYALAVRSASRLINVASTSDRVLQYAFPAGDWLAGIFTGGYTRKALGRHGPAASPRPPEQVRRFQVGVHGVGHGDYLGGDSALRRRASELAGHAIQRDEPLSY